MLKKISVLFLIVIFIGVGFLFSDTNNQTTEKKNDELNKTETNIVASDKKEGVEHKEITGNHHNEIANEEHKNNEHGEENGKEGHKAHQELKGLPIWSAIPFVGILLSIALLPLFAPKFWHHNFGKLSAFWALSFSVPFLFAYKSLAIHEILHIYLIDYIPFIILLWALFTISGGILLKGKIKGKPVTNLIFLIIGTFLSSVIGTTGSAMLLIRPIIRANAHRKNKVHIIVFFIFLVANIGGSLTPLGDPPLFLGFLHNVSFFWTLNLFPHMALLSAILLSMFFFLDSYYLKKEDLPEEVKDEEKEPIRILGWHNAFFLMGVIAGVLFSGMVKLSDINLFGIHLGLQNLVRDGFLIFMGFLSLKTTKKEVREGNGFTWFPIQEVAILFAGIFMTIIPALSILKEGGSGSLGFIVNAVEKPWQYFWVTGSLSSFLDNAPTYLTFFNTALGKFYSGMSEAQAVPLLMNVKTVFLQAISTGAVFMGAMTYIGNAPNFMVKSIAEENNIQMPSFFGYMIKYSFIYLLPAFIIVTLVFYS